MAIAEELIIVLKYKADKALGGLDKTKNKLSKIKAEAEKMKAVGQNLTTFVTLPILAAAAASVKFAIDAEETRAKFETAFRGVGDEADRVAKELQDGYGISIRASEKLLSGTGDLLKGFGATAQEALGLSSDVQKLATDLASYNNLQGGAERASNILTKAMLGEREALTSLGIKISEAAVKARLLEKGQENLTDRALLLARAQATLELATAQSGDALGDFARTQDSAANQIKILQATIEDLAVKLGQDLMPVFKGFLKGVQGLIKWNKELDSGTRFLIDSIGTFAVAIGPAILAVVGFQKAWMALSVMMTMSISAGGWIAIAIAGVVAINVAVQGLAKALALGDKEAKKLARTFADTYAQAADQYIKTTRAATDEAFRSRIETLKLAISFSKAAKNVKLLEKQTKMLKDIENEALVIKKARIAADKDVIKTAGEEAEALLELAKAKKEQAILDEESIALGAMKMFTLKKRINVLNETQNSESKNIKSLLALKREQILAERELAKSKSETGVAAVESNAAIIQAMEQATAKQKEMIQLGKDYHDLMKGQIIPIVETFGKTLGKVFAETGDVTAAAGQAGLDVLEALLAKLPEFMLMAGLRAIAGGHFEIGAALVAGAGIIALGGAIAEGINSVKAEDRLGGMSFPQFADGGVVQDTGLAFVHQGETVVPKGASVSGGGTTIIIQGNVWADEAFTRRVLSTSSRIQRGY